MGFEPTVPCGTTVFKTVALDHSATPPRFMKLILQLELLKYYRETDAFGQGKLIESSVVDRLIYPGYTVLGGFSTAISPRKVHNDRSSRAF